MMALRRMWDASVPPDAPPRVAAVAGYIGGGTPHVWSDAEWAASMRRSGARYKLPIFVRVPPTAHDPRVEARFCVDWARTHGQPKGTLIALDYETAVDAAYLTAFDQTIVAGGYRCIVYGSRSFVMQNPRPSGGYWTATWDNIPHLDEGATITQYGGDVTLGQPWDINVVADNAPLWDTQEDDMTIAELRKELTTIGSPTRTAIRELAKMGAEDAVGAELAAILEAVKAAADPELVAALIAGQLEITGITTDPGGVVHVTFGPKPTT